MLRADPAAHFAPSDCLHGEIGVHVLALRLGAQAGGEGGSFARQRGSTKTAAGLGELVGELRVSARSSTNWILLLLSGDPHPRPRGPGPRVGRRPDRPARR